MSSRSGIDRVKWFVFRHFERLLVLLLVASLLAIHGFIEYKKAFLSFYYLPVIVAGFYLGRNAAVRAAVLVVALVAFFQMYVGLGDGAGFFDARIVFTLVFWGGFLILTAFAVGTLADQRKANADDLKSAYVALLDVLTFHLESTEAHHQRGHSHLVAERAVSIGRELGLREEELDRLRVAALLHELGPHDQRLTRLLEQFPGATRGLPVAGSMRAALDLLVEYGHYHEQVGGDWPVDELRISVGAKILAIADAYETLLMPGAGRAPFAPWTALEEIEKGAGHTFGSEVVRALKRVAALTEPADAATTARLALVSSRDLAAS